MRIINLERVYTFRRAKFTDFSIKPELSARDLYEATVKRKRHHEQCDLPTDRYCDGIWKYYGPFYSAVENAYLREDEAGVKSAVSDLIDAMLHD